MVIYFVANDFTFFLYSLPPTGGFGCERTKPSPKSDEAVSGNTERNTEQPSVNTATL